MRLVDANALKKAISELNCAFGSVYRDDVYGAIDNAPTINKCDNCDLMFKEKTKKGGITE